jgi:predicted transcriptional regulator
MNADEEYATNGPFFQLFTSPVARVLDQAAIVGNSEQTISMLAESANLAHEKVQAIVTRLRKQGFIRKGRRHGRTHTYRFNVEKPPLKSLLHLAHQIQLSRR